MIGAVADLATVSALEVLSGWNRFAVPPRLMTPSEWADEKRVLPETSAARGAKWRTSSVPYMRGVMDAVAEPGTRKIAIMKAAQISGSEVMHNIIGYFMDYDPCPMLLLHPTIAVAEEWSKDRLKDMIKSTPALSAIVTPGGTLTYIEFPAGYLAVGGANSPNSFARRSVRVALGDDVDRFPGVVGDEGEPIDLLYNRTTTFDDPLGIFTSTPVFKGGRIDSLYERSDQRRYFVCCPRCHRWDWITWSDGRHFSVTWDERQSHTARVECPDEEHGGCGAQIFEPERRAIVGMGQWRPTAEPQEMGLLGFHVPALISTFTSVTLPYLVESWLSAQVAGKESVRVFITQKLAEGWEDKSAKMDPQGLLARLEHYGEDIEVPADAVAITAGIDVQENRFEVQVIAWGPAEERWVINAVAVPGDPRLDSTQGQLLQELNRKYTHASGVLLPVHATCIDSGFAAEEIYRFVLKHQSYRRIYATKGIAGKSGNPIILSTSEKRREGGKKSKSANRPVDLHLINVDDAKRNVMSSLSQQVHGPSYYHLPAHLDSINEEFVAQLCAEHLEKVKNRRGIVTGEVWVQDRERNEALDTAVLCLAAYRKLNPNIRQMLDALPKQRPTTETPAPAATQPAKRSRTIGKMNYGGGR